MGTQEEEARALAELERIRTENAIREMQRQEELRKLQEQQNQNKMVADGSAGVGWPDNEVQAFLAAGHVCAVMGFTQYEPIAARYRVPIVVTGFDDTVLRADAGGFGASYVVKPIKPSALLALIQQKLSTENGGTHHSSQLSPRSPSCRRSRAWRRPTPS